MSNHAFVTPVELLNLLNLDLTLLGQASRSTEYTSLRAIWKQETMRVVRFWGQTVLDSLGVHCCFFHPLFFAPHSFAGACQAWVCTLFAGPELPWRQMALHVELIRLEGPAQTCSKLCHFYWNWVEVGFHMFSPEKPPLQLTM